MKIALIGYGKMGRMIESLALEQGDEIVYISDRNRPLHPVDLKNSAADVAIEFTEPSSAVENLLMCFEAGVPVVTGTTGWMNYFPEVEKECTSKKGTLFYASNFSIGVNLFIQVNKHLARLMDPQKNYKVSMEEIHHTEKKDAPSGTAITLAEGLISEMNDKEDWVSGKEASDQEINITSQRLPEVPGTHTIRFESEEDFIEITHEAKGRKGFANGALSAARWVRERQGVFTMNDFLQL